MRITQKTSRMVRLAPLAASLTVLTFVVACARTNGRTPISEESAQKVISNGKATDPDYNEFDPKNMEFAKTIKGATLTVNNRDVTNSLDATVKVIFNDSKADLVARGLMTPSTKEKPGSLLVTGKAEDSVLLKAQCLNSSCQAVIVEVLLQGDAPAATAAAAPSAAAPAATDAKAGLNIAVAAQTADASTAPAADAQAQTAQPATADAAQTALPQPAAPAVPPAAGASTDAQAPAQQAAPAPKVIIARAMIQFIVDGLPKKQAPSSDDDAKDTKATALDISNTFVIRYSTPTEASATSGALVPFDAAYQDKYKKPAPSDEQLLATAQAAGECPTDGKGLKICHISEAPAVDLSLAGKTAATTVAPEGQAGIGTTSASTPAK